MQNYVLQHVLNIREKKLLSKYESHLRNMKVTFKKNYTYVNTPIVDFLSSISQIYPLMDHKMRWTKNTNKFLFFWYIRFFFIER
jgi:hypothetical protein